MPRPLNDAPFLTKIVVWISRPILVSAFTSRECMIDVCRLPCSSSTASAIAASTSGTRTRPITGIISSCTTNGWSAGSSATISRTPTGGSTPMARRISAAGLPTQPVSGPVPFAFSTSPSRRRTSSAVAS